MAKACTFCQGDIIEWYLNNCLAAFELSDKCHKKPLDMLRLSGEGLYEEVVEIYYDLMDHEMAEEN